MGSPKHLWSGDWEREAHDRAARQPEPAPAPEFTREPEGPSQRPGWDAVPSRPPEPSPSDGSSRRRPLIAAGVLIAVLVIAGVVLAITLTGSKSHRAQASAQATVPSLGQTGSGGSGIQTLSTPQPTTPTSPQQTVSVPTGVAAGPTYDWLGMQINAIGTDVTVGSITPNSSADDAGFNPGDVIESVGSTQINSIGDLQSAVKGLKLGQHFQVVVDRGSTPVTITATLTGRPARA